MPPRKMLPLQRERVKFKHAIQYRIWNVFFRENNLIKNNMTESFIILIDIFSLLDK